MFAGIIITLILIAIAFGHIPTLKMNRATIAFVGAVLLIGVGILNYENALKSIELHTLALLLSMMIINANFSVSGFFDLVSSKILKIADSPKKLLFLLIFASGYLSSLLLNDTVVIMFTPIVLQMLLLVKRNPIPYLIALGLSANIGSAMTPIGNPQNILIAGYSKISFLNFLKPLFLVSTFSLFITYFTIIAFYRKEFDSSKFVIEGEINFRIYSPLLIKSILALSIVLALSLMEFDISLSALAGASILLVTRRIKPERVFKEIDWALLLFFTSLFVITGAIVHTGIDKKLFSVFEDIIFQNYITLSFFIAILSNIVSNVPAVMILSPFINLAKNPEAYWIVVAMSSTFAGNLTIIGSVANIIVVETAKLSGVRIGFFEFLKVGSLVTILTILLGSIWLEWSLR